MPSLLERVCPPCITGFALPRWVVVRALATGETMAAETDGGGRFEVRIAMPGAYLIIVTYQGFSEAARTVLIEGQDEVADVVVGLDIGAIASELSVTAVRSEREARRVPLRVESIARRAHPGVARRTGTVVRREDDHARGREALAHERDARVGRRVVDDDHLVDRRALRVHGREAFLELRRALPVDADDRDRPGSGIRRAARGRGGHVSAAGARSPARGTARGASSSRAR